MVDKANASRSQHAALPVPCVPQRRAVCMLSAQPLSSPVGNAVALPKPPQRAPVRRARRCAVAPGIGGVHAAALAVLVVVIVPCHALQRRGGRGNPCGGQGEIRGQVNPLFLAG